MVFRKGTYAFELDKTHSVYTPRVQNFLSKKPELDDFKVYSEYWSNPLQRSLSDYDELIGSQYGR